ncbi:MAG: prepilin-type N-terminal cleavage/methylation domain-containing protein [Planctomycetaceae bacterium]
MTFSRPRRIPFVDRTRTANGHLGRRGFTLLEIGVVLAILVVLASLSWPALLRFVGERTIREQAHEVRVELANTRTKAIDTGLTYQFRFEPGGHRYIVLPNDRPEAESANGSGAAGGSGGGPTAVGLTAGTSTGPVVSRQLPERIHFEHPNSTSAVTGAMQPLTTERLPEEWLNLIPQSATLRDVGWSPAILFFPDGTSDDAALSLRDDDERQIDLTVRGLTGTVRANDPRVPR